MSLVSDVTRTTEPEPLADDIVRLDRTSVGPQPEANFRAQRASDIRDAHAASGLDRLYRALQAGLDRAHLRSPLAQTRLACARASVCCSRERVAVLCAELSMHPVHTRIVGGTPEPVSIREDLTVDVERTDGRGLAESDASWPTRITNWHVVVAERAARPRPRVAIRWGTLL